MRAKHDTNGIWEVNIFAVQKKIIEFFWYLEHLIHVDNKCRSKKGKIVKCETIIFTDMF